MTAATSTKTAVSSKVDPRIAARIIEEGYGPGAWHGPDMKAALADVTPALAFRRPAPDRHNIAEIALHHAYCVRAVRGQLSATTPEPFALEGEDWFPVSDESRLTWNEIQATVDAEQRRLATALGGLTIDADRFDLVLGITCHAVYHAGQVQLIKRLVQGTA